MFAPCTLPSRMQMKAKVSKVSSLTTTALGSRVACLDKDLLLEEAPQAYKVTHTPLVWSLFVSPCTHCDLCWLPGCGCCGCRLGGCSSRQRCGRTAPSCHIQGINTTTTPGTCVSTNATSLDLVAQRCERSDAALHPQGAISKAFIVCNVATVRWKLNVPANRSRTGHELCQCSAEQRTPLTGDTTYMMKFVLWPVVDNVPRRDKILYTGQRYTPLVGSSRLAIGSRCIGGKLVNSCLGRDSSRWPPDASQRAPSRKRPRM